jgi:PGF-CTERM protein/PGF-pre-PGF domain-containing protein
MLLIAPGAAMAVPSPPHEVFGTVTDQNGNPVADVTVTVTDAQGNAVTATTDGDGYYEIKFPAADGDKGETLTVAAKETSKTTSFASGESESIDLQVEVATPTPTPSSGGGGDGGSSGGGGGGASLAAQPTSGSAALATDGSTTVDLSGGTDVQNVELTVPGASGDVTVEEMFDLPGDVLKPSQTVVTAVDISAPNPTDGAATVRISVSPSLVDAYRTTPANLAIAHYSDGQWTVLDTEVVSENPVTLEAQTEGFSLFAVVKAPNAASGTPTATATPEPADTPEPTATSEPAPEPSETDTVTATPTGEQFPGFGPVVAIVALLGAALIALRRHE